MALTNEQTASARKHGDRDEVKWLERRIETLHDEIGELNQEICELEDSKDRGALEDGINELLDLVERPVGSLNAQLPPSQQTARALIRLYDLIGRTL